jgi:hypothetical protein
VEKRGADVALQGPDLLRQRGLRHPRLLRRTREVPRFRDRDEVGQLLELHAAIIASTSGDERNHVFAL